MKALGFEQKNNDVESKFNPSFTRNDIPPFFLSHLQGFGGFLGALYGYVVAFFG